MSKLVDKERLAKLAKALDERAKAAVAAEKERALAAEQAIEAKANANAAAIAAINNTENGLLAQAKSHAQGLVDGEKERAEGAEGLLSGRIETLEGIVGGEAEGALGQVKKDVADNKTAITTLNSKVDVEGSVTKAITDAVAVEKERAEGAEQKLSERIAATETFVAAQPAKDKAQNDRLETLEKLVVGGEGEGLSKVIEDVATAKAAADAAQADVDAVEQRLDAEGGLVDRIEAVENFRDVTYPAAEAKVREDFAAADTELHTTISDEIDADVLVETNRATAKEAELLQAINNEAARADAAEKANKAVIDKLDGTVDVEGSVKKQIKDAIDEVNGAAETLAGKVQANETKLAGLTKATVKAEIEAAQVAAEKHADDAITALVDSAPEAMDTLKELATAISANKGVYDAYVEQHATAMATMKSDLQKEIDADVKVVADELTKQKDAAQEGTLAKKIADEVARADAEEKAIRAAFAAEDKKLAGQIKAVEEMLGLNSGAGQTGAFAQVQADIATLQGTVGDAEKGLVKDVADLKAADTTLQNNIDLKVAKADYNIKVAELENADTALSNRIKVFEAGGAQDVAAKEARLAAAETFIQEHSHEELQGEIDAVEGRLDVLETFKNTHDHTVMEKGIADNKAAIEKEVEDRDAAIEEALKVYSTTEEMKGIIGNVVNSLALTMENDKVVLKLGGKDGIALAEVSLDMASDEDIDAIIAGLDK